MIICTFRIKDFEWTAWLKNQHDVDIIGQVWGVSQAEVVGLLVLQFPEYFDSVNINYVTSAA